MIRNATHHFVLWQKLIVVFCLILPSVNSASQDIPLQTEKKLKATVINKRAYFHSVASQMYPGFLGIQFKHTFKGYYKGGGLTEESRKILKDSFNCSVIDTVNNHYFNVQIGGNVFNKLFFIDVIFNEERDKVVIKAHNHGCSNLYIYYDRSEVQVSHSNNDYRFLGDSLIFMETNRLMGWDSINNNNLYIFKHTNNDFSKTDTIFTMPGYTGYLSNPVATWFSVADGKWIFEWLTHTYVQGGFIHHTPYNKKCYTIINKKEFYFYEYRGKSGIIYDGADYGKLGYKSIYPLRTDVGKAKFIGKKGLFYYEVTLE